MDLLGIGTPRRFVTGLLPDGTSYYARIEEVEEIDYAAVYPDSPKRPAGATLSHRMWAWDEFPTLPVDGPCGPRQKSTLSGLDTRYSGAS